MATPPNYVPNIRQIEYRESREAERKSAALRISQLQKTLNTIKERIIECNVQLSQTRTFYQLSWIKSTNLISTIFTPEALRRLTRQEVEDIKSNLILERTEVYREQLRLENNYQRQFGSSSGGTTTTTGGTTETVAQSPPVTYSSTVNYNASTVKEAYFYTGMS